MRRFSAVDGYFKDLVTSGLGEFSSTIEEQLKTEKSFSLEHREEIDNSIRVDNQDAYVLGKDTIQTPEVSTSKMGIQGWKLLFTVLSPAKWSLVLALLFTFLTVFMNVGLLTVSAWLLASAALQPGLTYLSLAIVGVRFFGVSRAVCVILSAIHLIAWHSKDSMVCVCGFMLIWNHWHRLYSNVLVQVICWAASWGI